MGRRVKPIIDNGIDPKDHVGLAYQVAWKFKYLEPHTDIDDSEVLSRSFIGLCNAAAKFDPSRGFQFSTYAYAACRREILNMNRKMGDKLTFLDDHELGHNVPEREERGLNYADRAYVRELFDSLPILRKCDRRRKAVVYDYYWGNLTLVEIAKKYGFSKERSRQIRDDGINTIKEMLRKNGEKVA